MSGIYKESELKLFAVTYFGSDTKPQTHFELRDECGHVVCEAETLQDLTSFGAEKDFVVANENE